MRRNRIFQQEFCHSNFCKLTNNSYNSAEPNREHKYTPMKAEGLVVIRFLISMYTKNPQIKISLLNYSHSSINLSFDVLDGLLRQCPLYFNMLTARSCTTVLLLWKKIHFLKCCIFSESHQILVTQVLIFG